jgi:hypothetical protein
LGRVIIIIIIFFLGKKAVPYPKLGRERSKIQADAILSICLVPFFPSRLMIKLDNNWSKKGRES